MNKYLSKQKIVCFGEILWDILPHGKQIGGAPLNVAYHLHKLGADVSLISRIGKDDLGRDIQDFIRKNGLSGSVLQTDFIHPTSTVQAEIGPGHEVSYTIVEKIAWDFIEYDEEIDKLIHKSDYLVFGSLIARNKVSENTLYKIMESPLTKVFDINLRRPFYSKDIIRELLLRSDIVKTNEAELHIIANWFDCRGDDTEKMKSLSDLFNMEMLIVTCGAAGAYLWYKDQLLFAAGQKVNVIDTVGSGDAFLAGFLYGYLTDKPLEQALAIAHSMGAMITQKAGGCPDYGITEVQKIIG